MSAADWVGVAVGVLAIIEGLRRLTRSTRIAVAHFLREARNSIYDIRGYVTRNPRTGETTRTQGMAERLVTVEREVKPNGGESLRDRVDHVQDRLDEVHAVALDNNDKHIRIERRLDEQARLTADAARLAAKNDDEIEMIRAETNKRHQENLARLDALERNNEDGKILREWALMLLRDNHGIDLMQDEDSGGR